MVAVLFGFLEWEVGEQMNQAAFTLPEGDAGGSLEGGMGGGGTLSGIRSDSVASALRTIATAPVRTISMMPKGRSTSTRPSILSPGPVISDTRASGPTSMTRARKTSQRRITSLRFVGSARTL